MKTTDRLTYLFFGIIVATDTCPVILVFKYFSRKCLRTVSITCARGRIDKTDDIDNDVWELEDGL